MAAQAAEKLRGMILRRELAVGQPLREMELCHSLGISRIPLREALHHLEGEGLVEIRPNRGAVVTSLSVADIREIAEACRLLESHLLRLAVPELSVESLDAAEALLADLDGIDDLMEWSRVNWRFHTTLYSAAERPLLVSLLTKLRSRAEPAMFMLVSERKRRMGLNREHRAILACVRARRATKAVALLDAHLLGGKDEVLRLMGATGAG